MSSRARSRFDYFSFMEKKKQSKTMSYCDAVSYAFYKCIKDSSTCNIYDFDKKHIFELKCSKISSK